MRYSIPFCLVMLSFWVKANDTLTRAQVYNFEVGDTFDYRIDPAIPCNGPWYDSYYLRKVITGKFYSTNSDTLFYIEQNYSPNSMQIDTEVLTNLQEYEIFLDSITYQGHVNYFGVDTNSHYNGKLLNSVESSADFVYPVIRKFAEGLGLVRYDETYPWQPCFPHQITELVFYSKGIERWGTPMYIYNSVEDINANSFLVVAHSINDGNFSVTIGNSNEVMELNLYNVLGEKVATREIHEGENEIHFNDLPKGMYLWTVNSDLKQISSGKMILSLYR